MRKLGQVFTRSVESESEAVCKCCFQTIDEMLYHIHVIAITISRGMNLVRPQWMLQHIAPPRRQSPAVIMEEKRSSVVE